MLNAIRIFSRVSLPNMIFETMQEASKKVSDPARRYFPRVTRRLRRLEWKGRVEKS